MVLSEKMEHYLKKNASLKWEEWDANPQVKLLICFMNKNKSSHLGASQRTAQLEGDGLLDDRISGHQGPALQRN